MTKTITCTLCPNGCEIEADIEKDRIIRIDGNLCGKGKSYAIQELSNPKRNISSSVLVEGGELPLASVRLTAPVPRSKIFDVMREIKKQRLKAPVHSGQTVIQNVLGLKSDVIVTKTVLPSYDGQMEFALPYGIRTLRKENSVIGNRT